VFQNLAAIDPETLKNIALGISGVSVVLAIVMMKVVSSIVGKAISAVLLLAVALVGYSQREEIVSCLDAVTSQTSLTVPTEISCTFFGQDVSVKVPMPSK
jgi:hypothetical protein